MKSLTACTILLLLPSVGLTQPAPQNETRYLAFQVQTGIDGFGGPHPEPGRVSLSKTQIEEFVRSLTKAIGTTGDARNKLAFAIGPLCFDMPDDETRLFIRDAFAVAREKDVAVVLHIDDSMAWGRREDLISNPANLDTADWRQAPNTGRRLDWGPKPTKFPPQMCFNAPAVIAAVKDRGALIGVETKKQVDALRAAGKEHLFGGIIAGWETRIGRDFETDLPLGFRALSYRGFSESKPPNRMIGDEQLPEDSQRRPDSQLLAWPKWLLEGKPSPAGRHTFATYRVWKTDSPLQDSGLIGPVKLYAAQRIALK
jgi:hypothetical protein